MNNNNVFISIVIPVFNTDLDLLSRCFNSILAQTFTSYEVIVVDSSTNADVVKYISNFVNAHTNFKLIKSKKNVSFQRNVGIKKSCGDYISFIDSDDYISSNYLYDLFKSACDTLCDVCMPQTICVYFENNKIVKTIEDSNLFNFMHVDQTFYINNCIKFDIVSPVKLYKRTAIEDVFFDTKLSYGEDYFFGYEISKKGFTLNMCPNAKYFYVRNLSTQYFKKWLSIKSIRLLNNLYNIIKTQKDINNNDTFNFYNSAFEKIYDYSIRDFKIHFLLNLFKHRIRYFKFHCNISIFLYSFLPYTYCLIKKCLNR